MSLILEGYVGPDIAAKLYISQQTEKSYRKLDTHSKRELFILDQKENKSK